MNAHAKFPEPQQTEMAAESVVRIDARATNSAAHRKLYKSRIAIHPKRVHGRFRNLKWAVMIITLGIYYLVPWIRWDRGPGMPNQAVLVDLAHERFYFFFIELWPQEVYYITGLLILGAIALFLFTALFGRVWCGYACPQTVWTDLFVYVERFIEGDRSARIRLSAAPWSLDKIVKRISKHSIWILIAVMTGGAWVFYFADAPTLAYQLFHGEAPMPAYVFVGMLTFTTYSLGGLMREQVCTYMCPWPRIQGAMMDADALSVTYRRDRGEPRGPHKKGEDWGARGHCIDCNQCVAACPMGIDIRDGAQLECINCALCIDACDDVMTRIDLPKGLIAYDTDANVVRRQKGEPTHFRFVRPRTILYSVILVLVGAFMLYSLVTRPTLGLDVLRDRNPNFVRLSDGAVRNGYTIKLMNHAAEARTLTLSVAGDNIRELNVIGLPEKTNPASVTVEQDRIRTVRALVTVDPSNGRGERQGITFSLADPITGETQIVQTMFVSGEERRDER